jgi:hypothetical protein
MEKPVGISRLIAGLALTLLVLCNAQGAHAQSSCPTSGETDTSIDVSVSGDCTISGDLIATSGSVTVNVSGGTLTVSGQVSATGAITLTADNGISIGSTTNSGNELQATSSAGSISFGDAISSGGGADIVLNGYGDISASSSVTSTGLILATSSNGGITFTGTATSAKGDNFVANNDIALQGGLNNNSTGGWYDIRFFPNQSGTGSDTFQIGQTGAPNGALYIYDNNDVGGRTVYITNGGTGGISYSGTSSIQVSASAGQPGTIILDAGSQNLTVSGSLNVDGSSGQDSGSIVVFSAAVIANGATISASAPGFTSNGIGLYTYAITDNSGLTLDTNGNSGFPGYENLTLEPYDSYSVSAPTDYTQPITNGAYGTSENPLAITGAGDLTINANGNNNGTKIWGYPFTLTTATATINLQGSGNGVSLDSWDGGSNQGVVTLGGTIQIHANTTAAGQTPNSIEMSGTAISPSPLVGNVLFDASGTGGGDGGTIGLYPNTGEVDFGGTGNYFTLNANGSSTGGSGGNITVYGDQFTVQSANAITASVLGANGNGGSVTLAANDINFMLSDAALNTNAGTGTGNGGGINLNTGSLEFAGAASSMSANGGQTAGNGGTITLDTYSALTVGSGTDGDLALSATASGSSNTTANMGGTIELEFLSALTIDGGSVSVASAGDANGGILNFHDLGQTTSTGTLAADGSGNGNGGSITIAETDSNTMTLGTISASAGTDQGDGGEISVSSFDLTLASNSSITANGQGSGQGGNITVTASDDDTPLDLTEGQQLIATGGSDSMTNGGSVTLPNVGTFNLDQVIDVFPGEETIGAAIRRHQSTAGVGPDTSPSFTAMGSRQVINGITCQAYSLTGGANAYPAFFWDCVTPDSPSPTDELPAAWIADSTTLSNVLSTLFPPIPTNTAYSLTPLYVLTDPAQFTTLYGQSARSDVGALTLHTTDNNGNIWTAVNIFENFTGPSGYVPINASQMTANTAHELGHVLDFRSAGGNYWSTNLTYTSAYIPYDQTALNNNAGINDYDKGASPNTPCSTNNSAAFDGQPSATGSIINDVTGLAICDESTGELASGNPGSPPTNNNIAVNAAGGILGSARPTSELFAEAFGWNAYGSTITNPDYSTSFFQRTTDGLFLNGYYACSVAWAKYALTGTSSFPDYCSGD